MLIEPLETAATLKSQQIADFSFLRIHFPSILADETLPIDSDCPDHPIDMKGNNEVRGTKEIFISNQFCRWVTCRCSIPLQNQRHSRRRRRQHRRSRPWPASFLCEFYASPRRLWDTCRPIWAHEWSSPARWLPLCRDPSSHRGSDSHEHLLRCSFWTRTAWDNQRSSDLHAKSLVDGKRHLPPSLSSTCRTNFACLCADGIWDSTFRLFRSEVSQESTRCGDGYREDLPVYSQPAAL